METIQGIGILVVFILTVFALMRKLLPAMLALPLASVLFAVVAGIPFFSTDSEVFTITQNILEAGCISMASTIAAVLFGSIFGQVLNNSGISKGIIRKAAELAGDKQIPIALALMAATAIIFSGASWVGVTIMVGTIAIPIMLSVGISPLTAASVLLGGQALGSIFNIARWSMYITALGVDVEIMTAYSLFIFIPMVLVCVGMNIFFIKKENKVRRAWAVTVGADETDENPVPLLALISPFIPIALVLIVKLPFVASILCGCIAALLLSRSKHPIKVLSKSFIEGIQNGAGPVSVILGVGMLMTTIKAPQMASLLGPLVEIVVPHTAIGLIILFGIGAPLCLYRGPLNMLGLGSGIAALFVMGGMNPTAAMMGFRSCEFLQTSSCPTNSQNIWTADFAKTETDLILKRQILFFWPGVIISILCACFKLF